MKTEGHTINPVYYYYSLTLYTFNGPMMSSKQAYIFSRVKNQVLIGQLTAVVAIKKKQKKKTPGSETQFIRCRDKRGM